MLRYIGREKFGVDDLFVALDVNKAEWLEETPEMKGW